MLRSGRPLRLLVSCCNIDGCIALVEVRKGSSKVTKLADGGATGIGLTPDESTIYVGRPDSVEAFDKKLKKSTRMLDLPGADVHDIKVLRDGSIAVVETSHNQVSAFAPDGSLRWAWHPSPGDGDRCHVNSLLETRDGLLTSMFTREGLGEPWRERLNGTVMLFRPESSLGGDVVIDGIEHPHSLIESGDAIWACESKQRRVIRFSRAHPERGTEIVTEISGYARGLCLGDGWIAVGQSRSDAHFVSPLIGDRAPAISVGCGVWLIMIESGERTFIELPAKEVYDIVALPR